MIKELIDFQISENCPNYYYYYFYLIIDNR